MRTAREAGLLAARASYIAGFAGTATVLAGRLFGIPVFGTMAHSYIQAHDNETEAFERFARARPEGLVLLIDTYDTEAAARKIVALAPRLKAAGISVRGVRLDSGDLIALSKSVRRILDEGGLAHVTIFASGGLDEDDSSHWSSADAPIDGFGIGTSLDDLLRCARARLRLQAAGICRTAAAQACRTGKATWPGRKQVWRRYGADGRMAGDILSLENDNQDGEPLIQPVMQAGKPFHPRRRSPRSENVRRASWSACPDALRELEPGATYPVQVGEGLGGRSQRSLTAAWRNRSESPR